ncbi:DUF397 domain-containing protein [Streptomyces sp. NPDC057636]|uniref:DUF397 domain-containing protein n=1 Tax=Streptomyces sp. NPDC057636 TaxID=3346189 RepID=UPI0036A255AC
MPRLSGFVDGRFATSPAMAVVTYGVTILTFLWVVPFIFWGVGLALVHVFRTADIHETVPPLLAMALVWEMTLIDLFTGQRNGACVEIARAPENWVAVRDSTDLDMGLTMTTNRAWARDWGLPPRAAFHQVWPHGPRSCRRAGVVNRERRFKGHLSPGGRGGSPRRKPPLAFALLP